MFKRLSYAFCLAAVFFVTMSAPAARAREITVMTRNLYLGADLAPVITAQTKEAFEAAAQKALAQIAASNFPERAVALAKEIAERKPHLVGLQEVYNFTLNGNNGLPPFRNHLVDLMTALSAQGANYRIAAVVRNIDLRVPLGEDLVGVTDRDVILARTDVSTSVVPVAGTMCNASLDGCNYQVVARVVNLRGSVAMERGFVAVDVDSLAGNGPVRFVNTHLEARGTGPANPLFPAIQAAQASELITILAGMPNPLGAKIVIAGDINSSPRDQTRNVGPYTIVPPYRQLTAAGYTDAWTLQPGNPPGYTCCQAGNLLNAESIINERIDVTFTSELPAGKVKVNIVGNDKADKTSSGLWPSDHAGVVTRMEFAR